MSQPAGDKPREVFDLSRDPIKHFVRICGWVDAARNRLDELRAKNARREYGLRYFTLCGKDGIDIFLFKRWELITDDGRGFPSIFYCESYYPSFAEVRPFLGRTRGKRMEFEVLVRQNWFEKHIRKCPFDVVNLDFSGSCFPREDPPFSKTLRSILTLVELQKGHEFDLFVTFKALRSHENEEAINKLLNNMKTNLEQVPEIEKEFQGRFEGMTLEQLLERDYGQFLLATFPKIIFGFGSANGFVVSCPQKFVYRRQPPWPKGAFQIIKFLFSFAPLEVPQSFVDVSRRSELLAQRHKESTVRDLAVEPIEVNNEFQKNPELHGLLRSDCESILTSRRPFGL